MLSSVVVAAIDSMSTRSATGVYLLVVSAADNKPQGRAVACRVQRRVKAVLRRLTQRTGPLGQRPPASRRHSAEIRSRGHRWRSRTHKRRALRQIKGRGQTQVAAHRKNGRPLCSTKPTAGPRCSSRCHALLGQAKREGVRARWHIARDVSCALSLQASCRRVWESAEPAPVSALSTCIA